MGKNEDPNLQQRQQGLESGNNHGSPGFLRGGCFSRLGNEFSFRCIFALLLGLSVLLPGIFWIIPFRSIKSGFDAKQAIKFCAPVHVYFTLQKPVSELVQHIGKLEYDINEEIGVPKTKVAILSMHQLGASNSTGVVFGFLSDPINVPINPVFLIVLRASLVDLFIQRSNLTLTTSIFGQPSELEILKFPGGISIVPPQPAPIFERAHILFNFTLYSSIVEIQGKFIELKDQLKYGLRLRSYENVFLRLTSQNGSTITSPVTVQASVLSDIGILLPQRLKQLAQTITDSPAKNLGLNNTIFGKVKSVNLSSYLKGTLHATPPTPSPAPSPGPSITHHPTFPPAHSPVLSPRSHHLPRCKCKRTCRSGHHSQHSPSPRSSPHPSFAPTSISPSPFSAVTQPPSSCSYFGHVVPPSSSTRSHFADHPPVMSPQSDLPTGLAPIPLVSYGSRLVQGKESMNGPVSAPLAQSPSSLAVRTLTKEDFLLGFLGLLIFNLFL